VRVKDQEIVRTKSQKNAVSVFNRIRREMKKQFPDRPATQEEKQQLLKSVLNDSLVDPYTVRKKKKSTAKGTRTFG
jgi:hypothetical protein